MTAPTLTLAFKGKTLQVFPLKEGLTTVGRDEACDIHIDSLAVEPLHAHVVNKGDDCTLYHRGGDNTTFVNHRPVNEHVLEHNDIIRIGKHTLQFREDAAVPLEPEPVIEITPAFVEPQADTAPATAVAPVQATAVNDGWLQILSGRKLGKTIKLKSGLTDLGKLGMHPALIALRSNGYFISNLADDYSLSVDEQDIGDSSRLLNDGDIIKLGDLTLQFHLNE